MLTYYWSLGRDIVKKQAESKWGSGFFNQLSLDMKAMFPDDRGFSSANLRYMKRWYLFYYEQVVKGQQAAGLLEIPNDQRPVDKLRGGKGQQLAGQINVTEKGQQDADQLEMPEVFGQIPWYHHIRIISHCKSLDEAMFYMNKTTEEGWSRSWLEDQIAHNLYRNQGSAITRVKHWLEYPYN